MNKNIILLISLVSVLPVIFLITEYSNFNNDSTNIPNNDWVIIPNEKIGPLIKNDIDKQDAVKVVKNAFGEKNVKQLNFSIGEGQTIPGFAIYPNTENEIDFYITNKEILFKLPAYNTYFDSNPDLSSQIKWKISNGIKIGSTLSEVQKINGKSFNLSGFEWDYPGVVSSWLNGSIASELSVVFQQTAKKQPSGYEQILGNVIISSDNPVLRETDPVVNFIYIKWDFK